MVKKIILFFSFILFFNNYFLAYAQEIPIRVAILDKVSSFRIDLRGKYKIIDLETGKTIYKGKNIYNKEVKVQDTSGIVFAGNIFETKRLKIIPSNKYVYVNNRKLRGFIYIILKKNTLHIINSLDLEEYLKGVLPTEASFYWPAEVLKAQAITARTFALYQVMNNTNADFDVKASIYSQMYGGRFHERYRTNKAVMSTKNQILTFEDEIFPAYYHATCAGRTESANEVWKKEKDIMPLRGIECIYCKESPRYFWNSKVKKEELLEKINQGGYKVNDVKDIQLLDFTKSGRVKDLVIDSGKQKIKMQGKDFRHIIGPNIIRSLKFNVILNGNFIIFKGTGWGHGVGLCQWGAYFMARQGFGHEEILKYYYPGAKITLLK